MTLIKLGPPTKETPLTTPRPSPVQLKRKIGDGDSSLSALDIRPTKLPKPYTKHETHWFLDGNVVLRIGNTGFKLHKSRLASESSWFQILFDLRSGTVFERYTDEKEIDPVLEAVEVVDGCDLYCLDNFQVTSPNAIEFTELLTAMDNAIEYALNPPGFPVLAQIIEAADFFRFTRYQTFAEESARKLFPDTPSSITDTPIPYAAQAVVLGRSYRLPEILRCAFYELARTAPTAPIICDESEIPTPDSDPLESIPDNDLRYLLKLQKNLSLSWDGIRAATVYTCQSTGDPNHKYHTSCKTVLNLQQKHMLDPIQAITILVNHKGWAQAGYCPQAAGHVRARLLQERDSLWAKMAEWLDIKFAQ